MRSCSLILALVSAPTMVAAQPDPEPPTDPSADPPKPDPPKPDPPKPDPPKPIPKPAPTAYDRCIHHRAELADRAQQIKELPERGRQLAALPNCDTPAGLATADEPLPPPPEPAVTDTHVHGLAFETRIESALVALGEETSFSTIQPGVFVGYHGPMFTTGIGFQYTRIHQGDDGGGDITSSSFLLVPSVRTVLARTADRRTEAVGQLDLGYGAAWSSTGTTPNPNAPKTRLIRAQIGIGLRHWITQSFAIGGTVGLRYDRVGVSTTDSMTGVTVSADSSVTGLFSSVQMLAVF